MARSIANFSLDPELLAWFQGQAQLEGRPMSRIVARLLTEYRAKQAEKSSA